MMGDNMDSVFSNMETINSESAIISVNDGQEGQEYSGFPPLPTPTPTDFQNLYKQELNARSKKSGHVPRPKNAFISFRSDLIQQTDFLKEHISDHRDLSRFAGDIWRKMSDAQKKPWFDKAEEERRYHLQAFPEYRYSPTITDRPKRVYRKRKRPVPLEEILLQHPHHQSESSLSTTQDAPPPPQVVPASSASSMTFSPPVSCIDSSASSTNWQDPDLFPDNYMHYQYDSSASQSNQALYSEPLPLSSPQAYGSGYIDDSGDDFGLCPDTVPNGFDHLRINAHYDGGYWQNSMTGGAEYAMAPGNAGQVSMNLSPDPLYRWRHLETPQQTFYVEANQTTLTVPHFSYGADPEAHSSYQLISPSMPASIDIYCGDLPTQGPLSRHS